ncbi:MAG: M48 family metalloprotease [Pseudomonadota bacterium]
MYESIRLAEHKFESLSTQLLILAIFLFAINIYWFALPSYTQKISLFKSAPTFEALLFICLFVFYLSVVWACSYGAYKKLYPSDEMSRRSYITSNISFGVPVILPWLMLSVVIDIINHLPFDGPKNFLSTTAGEFAFIILFLFIIAITGPAIILKIWRCKPIEQGEHRFLIEAMCNRAGVKFSEILYWPLFGNRMITAGVMGLAKRFRYILVTKPLLRVLDPDEVKAVIAHEIGHVKRHHLAFYLLFFLGYIIVSFSVFDLILYAGIYAKPLFLFLSSSGVEYSTVISISSGILIIATFLVYFRFIFAYFMRNFERQADAYVYSLFSSAKPLISAFQKISYISGQPSDKPNWHHFSIKERIEYLYKCEDDKSFIKRQDRKIQKSIAVYLVCLIITGVIGYNLNFGESSKRINGHFAEKIFLDLIENNPHEAEKIILNLIKDNPENPDFPAMLGNLYYGIENYKKAKKAYEQSLAIDSKNPAVLNNLAWLYATCKDTNIRNPDLAVNLAESAVRIEENHQSLDTLAQSYFVAGRYKDAVEAGRKALSMAGKDKQYYEKQLAKFADHLQMGR